jgi:hypothetical protein
VLTRSPDDADLCVPPPVPFINAQSVIGIILGAAMFSTACITGYFDTQQLKLFLEEKRARQEERIRRLEERSGQSMSSLRKSGPFKGKRKHSEIPMRTLRHRAALPVDPSDVREDRRGMTDSSMVMLDASNATASSDTPTEEAAATTE